MRQTFTVLVLYILLLNATCLVTAEERFTTDISATCEEHYTCNASYHLLSAFERTVTEWDDEMQLPLRLLEETRDLKETWSRVGPVMGPIVKVLSNLRHVPYVGKLANILHRPLSLAYAPVSRISSIIYDVEKYIMVPVDSLHGVIMSTLSHPDGILGGVGELIETAISFNTSMNDMCILPMALDAFGGLIRPMQEQVDDAVTFFYETRSSIGDMTEDLKKAKAALRVNSDTLSSIKTVLAGTHSELKRFWVVVGPVVKAIANALAYTIEFDAKYCFDFFVFKMPCIDISFRVSIGSMLEFVGGVLASIFKLLESIPLLSTVIDYIEGLIQRAIDTALGPIIDILNIPVIPMPKIDWFSFPENLIILPLMNLPGVINRTKDAVVHRFSKTKQQVKAALETATDTVKESLGLNKTCFSGADPFECVKTLAPSVNFSMPIPVNLESIMEKIRKFDIFPHLQNGLKCSNYTFIPICDYITNATGCQSKLKIPICTSLGFAQSSAGKSLYSALHDFGAVAENRRRLSETESNGVSWTMIIYPGVQAGKPKPGAEYEEEKLGYKTRFVNFLNEKKHELPTYRLIDFGKINEIEIFEWQVRVLVSFSNGRFQRIRFAPRIKFLKVSVHKLWEPKSNWPEGLKSLVDYPIPKIPQHVGDTWEEKRQWVVGWLRRKINQGNHFDFSRLNSLSDKISTGSLLGLDFTTWDPLIEIAFTVAKVTAGPPEKNYFLAPDRGGVHVYWNNGLFETGFALRSMKGVFEFPLCFSVMLPRWGEIKRFWPSDKSIKSIFNFLTRSPGGAVERKNTFNAFFYAEWFYP